MTQPARRRGQPPTQPGNLPGPTPQTTGNVPSQVSSEPNQPDMSRFDALVAVAIMALEELQRDKARAQGREEEDGNTTE
ncbi:hypothetical protein CIB48_g10814 [Xylaria polymorpha]|nr:hypothetical protein CIB48_g10814 [Xylaria polymorpha]